MEKLYYNGKIITMAEEDGIYRIEPEAVLISEGNIKKVGSLDSVRKETHEDTEWVDLQGRCLMPSFIDAHSHIVMNGQMSLFSDLSDCSSFEDIVNTLTEYIENHDITSSGVVIGYGYDHNFLKEQKHPKRDVLDKVSATIPIMVLHISGHLACVNSVALELAGINEDTQAPAGGFIGRAQGSKEPDGYFEEAGLALIQPVLMERVQIDICSMMENMQDIYVRNGITTIQDGASTEDNIHILKSMSELGYLKTDVVAYPLIADNGAEIIKKNKDIDNNYVNHLKIGGYKIILDGSPQGRTAWLSEPYAGGDREYCGYGTYDDKTVEKYVMQAVQEQKQILAHCNGDAASEQFLNAYERCIENKNDGLTLRPVMIHCQTVRNDQLDRMAQIRMIASIFIGHVWYWGDTHLQNLGEERGKRISPVKDAVDRGVVVNFHQDTPVTKPNMLHSVWCAVKRVSRNGVMIGKEQRIGVYEALKAITINAAYEYFEEDEKGSIEEGKKADLVILSESPLDIDVDKIKDIRVLETIKDGVTIFRAE